MMHTSNHLYEALNIHLIDLNQQIETIVHDLQMRVAALPYPEQTTIYMMRNADGSYVMAELLAAKAQVLSGMAALKAAEVASKASKR